MMKKLWKLTGIKRFLILMLLFSFIQAFAMILAAKWLAEVIVALFEGDIWTEQMGKLIGFLVAFLVRHFAIFLQQRVADRFAQKQESELRKRLIEKLFQTEPRFAKKEGTGKLVTLVQDGVKQFCTYLELFFPRMAGVLLIPPLVLLYISRLDFPSSLILAVTVPILIIFLILVGMLAQKQSQQQWESFRMLANHFVDSLRGIETLKFLGQSKVHQRSIEKVNDQYRKATMRTLRFAFLSTFALEFFTMLSIASVAVGLGLRLIDGGISFVTALTILILAPDYFLPIQRLGADYHATLNGKEAGEKIATILDRKNMFNVSKLPASFQWNNQRYLQLKQVRVQYEETASPALQEISLQIKGFRKIGIVGTSGAGKSTLIDVLAGFQSPTAGTIQLDGYKLETLTDKTWRNLVTYIPQHPYLFHRSLKDNIRFYRPDASEREVEQAVINAGLLPFVTKLPNGLDEMVGNGGRSVSGGQEQRIALVRAFLSNRPILLLDEPTAHLDIETEYELKKTMLRLFENKLVFFATHRYHWMPEMDEVLVLDQGRLVERGTHEELLKKQGVYYQLITQQGVKNNETKNVAVASG